MLLSLLLLTTVTKSTPLYLFIRPLIRLFNSSIPFLLPSVYHTCRLGPAQPCRTYLSSVADIAMGGYSKQCPTWCATSID